MESLEKKLTSILEDLSKQISGTLGISVVELESGMALQSFSNQQSFDLDVAAAYNAEVVKQKQKAMAALELHDQELTEFIISLTTQIHVISFINGAYILYFAVDSSTSNLAMIRVALKNTREKLKIALDSI